MIYTTLDYQWIMRHKEAELPLPFDVFKSMTWSQDGNSLYVMLRNASIMKMQVSPASSQSINGKWSQPNLNNEPVACPTANHVCVSLPQLLSSDPQTRISMICTLSMCSPPSTNMTYLVRVMANGNRLGIKTQTTSDGPSHQLPGIGLHLLYDRSWNMLYWTVLQGTTKKLFRVILSTDYSILEAPAESHPALLSLVQGGGGLTFEAAALQPGKLGYVLQSLSP